MVPSPDPHKNYERKLAIWLGITYVVIALMSAALVVYSALKLGFRPGMAARP